MRDSQSCCRQLLTLAFVLALLAAPLFSQASSGLAETSSIYIPMRDGTRLAIDIHLPAKRPPDDKLPCLIEQTRYWRSSENPKTGQPNPSLNALDRYFLEHGYALVKVDVRGTGASFGSRQIEYGRQEVRDGHDVVDWIVKQPWSSGKVGAYGTSYTGTTAELLAAVRHPAVQAVIPGWSDFDTYRSPARPYGLLTEALIPEWSQLVGWLDSNQASNLGAGVKRVDADRDGALLAQAVAEHASNPDVYQAMKALVFRDQKMGSGEDSLAEASSLYWKKQIEASGVPMLVLASWLDAGTADGALLRFQHYRNPQKLVILASSHGGGFHGSPYAVSGQPTDPIPTQKQQFELRLAFFDHYLKGRDKGVEQWPAIRYFNLGQEAFLETDRWPPRGVRRQRYFLGEGRRLTSRSPSSDDSIDVYTIDFSVTTGKRNRWATQMGRPVLNLDNRSAMDERMLTYTSDPLPEDLQITGSPVMVLHVASDHQDGAFLVYLEDVDGKGRSRYLTEGGLRAIHRKLSRNPYFQEELPFHSFAQSDARPLVPNQVAEIQFRLLPTSVLIRKGHRLRLAITGADEGTLERVPAQGTPTITLHRNRVRASLIDLPVVEG